MALAGGQLHAYGTFALTFKPYLRTSIHRNIRFEAKSPATTSLKKIYTSVYDRMTIESGI